jgi:hypothetical protein
MVVDAVILMTRDTDGTTEAENDARPDFAPSVVSAHGVHEREEDQAAEGGQGDGAHHLRALLGCLLGAFCGLQDLLGVVERGLHLGDARLGVLDGVWVHDVLLRRV